MTTTLYLGDCLDILPTLPSESVDAVITDPPYPCIKRDYGMLTEAEWWDLMMGVCKETRRILKPTGSAVFILQPNSKHVGQMRGWLWEFMAWVCREWNMVQDAYWWNTTSAPIGGSTQFGLLRSSIKACVWCGIDYCYRNQGAVLWGESEENFIKRTRYRAENKRRESNGNGYCINDLRARNAVVKNGGVTPFNVLPFSCGGGVKSQWYGHGASTPLKLADWWTRYICPPGGVVGDWFVGSGTMMLAAIKNGCNGIGIDKEARYIEISQARIAETEAQERLIA